MLTSSDEERESRDTDPAPRPEEAEQILVSLFDMLSAGVELDYETEDRLREDGERERVVRFSYRV